jgi:hypothetical protein
MDFELQKQKEEFLRLMNLLNDEEAEHSLKELLYNDRYMLEERALDLPVDQLEDINFHLRSWHGLQ